MRLTVDFVLLDYFWKTKFDLSSELRRRLLLTGQTFEKAVKQNISHQGHYGYHSKPGEYLYRQSGRLQAGITLIDRRSSNPPEVLVVSPVWYGAFHENQGIRKFYRASFDEALPTLLSIVQSGRWI